MAATAEEGAGGDKGKAATVEGTLAAAAKKEGGGLVERVGKVKAVFGEVVRQVGADSRVAKIEAAEMEKVEVSREAVGGDEVRAMMVEEKLGAWVAELKAQGEVMKVWAVAVKVVVAVAAKNMPAWSTRRPRCRSSLGQRSSSHIVPTHALCTQPLP